MHARPPHAGNPCLVVTLGRDAVLDPARFGRVIGGIGIAAMVGGGLLALHEVLIPERRDVVRLGAFLVVALVGAALTSRSAAPAAGVRGPHLAAVAPDPLIEPLTDRELEVLVLLSRGLSNGEIALEFGVSQNTVKTHLEHIYGKLGVPSRGRAVAEAQRRALLPSPVDRFVP